LLQEEFVNLTLEQSTLNFQWGIVKTPIASYHPHIRGWVKWKT